MDLSGDVAPDDPPVGHMTPSQTPSTVRRALDWLEAVVSYETTHHFTHGVTEVFRCLVAFAFCRRHAEVMVAYPPHR